MWDALGRGTAPKHNGNTGGNCPLDRLFQKSQTRIPAAGIPQIGLLQRDQIIDCWNKWKFFLQQNLDVRIVEFQQMAPSQACSKRG